MSDERVVVNKNGPVRVGDAGFLGVGESSEVIGITYGRVACGDVMTAAGGSSDAQLLDIADRHLKSARAVPGGWDIQFQGGAPTVYATTSLREALARAWEATDRPASKPALPLVINGEPVRVDDAGGD